MIDGNEFLERSNVSTTVRSSGDVQLVHNGWAHATARLKRIEDTEVR